MAEEPDQTKWVGIRPATGCNNIPVTESNPVEVVSVFPLPDSDYFKVFTRKDSPAISDLQAIKDVYGKRVMSANKNCAVSWNFAGDTVPAGEMWVITSATIRNETSVCDILFRLTVGGSICRICGWYDVPINVFKNWTGMCVLKEDDSISYTIENGGATDDLQFAVLGYKIARY